MKQIISFLLLLCATSVSAQGIKTTFTRDIYIDDGLKELHAFAIGDSVTIYGYKRKNSIYYFNIETKYYADLIDFYDIPFDVTEKALKKLPNALSDEQKDFMRLRKQYINQKILEQKKQNAFSGKFLNIVSSDRFTRQYSTDDKIEVGDTVYIVGYKDGGYANYQYALYNDKAAGIYIVTREYDLFKNKINKDDFPPADDADVVSFLEEKKQEILRRKAEEKVRYRKQVLDGKVQAIVRNSSYLKKLDDGSKSLEDKDTVTIVGYSQNAGTNYYALYSNSSGVVGDFTSTSENRFAFYDASDINFADMPAYDDPEVKFVIQKQKQVIDSLLQIRRVEQEKEFAELTKKLFQMYKDNQPFIISDIYWSANSVGGIEVSLSITNCTQQTIKYVTFQGYFMNAVGDKCWNEIGGGTVWKGRGIGPIGPCPSTIENTPVRFGNNKASYNFDNPTFYSRIADTFRLSSVTVEYTNGKKITLSGANLYKHVRQ